MRYCLGVLIVVVAMGCEDRGRAYAPPPPPEVGVAKPTTGTVTSYCEFTGTTTGVEEAEVRARVKGFLKEMHYEPGGMVKEGDLLFTIDPSTFEVAVRQAQAQVNGAQAALDILTVQYTKIKDLFAKQAATALEVDEWKAKVDQARATLDGAKASLAAAELDLSFCEVRALISGRVSENRVDVGTLVGAGDATLLTTVINDSRVFARFDISESDLLRLRSEQRDRGVDPRELGTVPIEMSLSNEKDYPHRGVIDFADNTVDATTGTMRLRAVFENPEGLLQPGLFVRLRAVDTTGQMKLVPESALGRDQGGRFLLVVGEDGTVERRGVEVGPTLGEMRAIKSGITGEEAVIVRGLLRARLGAKVQAKPISAS